jgi:starch synthase
VRLEFLVGVRSNRLALLLSSGAWRREVSGASASSYEQVLGWVMSIVGQGLRVCMLAAEARPYASDGGLADVVAALSAALIRLHVHVRTILPLYWQVRRRTPLHKIADLPPVRMGDRLCPGSLHADPRQDPPAFYFIENHEFFDRSGIYNDSATGEGYADNFERFNFFTLAALEALRHLDLKPQILHCHDSQTGLAPAYLKLSKIGDRYYRDITTLFTIHNLAYQGLYERQKFVLTGLPGDLFYAMGPFEYYGQLNLMKAAICYADVLNTVSPQYAREIQSPEYGAGLDNVLRTRKDDLHGILNGIDTEEWDPAKDPLIFAPFSADDLSGKRINKEKLQDLCGFAVRQVPLIGMISRLVDQKGVDLFLAVAHELNRMDCQWVILGSGLKKYQDALKELAREHPEKFSVHLGFDNRLAHRIEAGADIFVMPSRYEPCGLNQMYSMKYGAVPIVRHTGGLADTVRDFGSKNGVGTGFKFNDYSPAEFLKTIQRAVEVWKDKEAWGGLMRSAMSEDFSWERSARQYVELYAKATANL